MVGGLGHVVAEIVEAELIVGAIRYVGAVGLATGGRIQIVQYDADIQPERPVHRPHPLGVAPGQIVVDRDDVDSSPSQGIEIRGHGGHKRLAFARLHLGYLALMQNHSTHYLHIVGVQPQLAPSDFPRGRESLRKQRVEGFAAIYAILELGRTRQELLVRGLFRLRRHSRYSGQPCLEILHIPRVHVKHALEKVEQQSHLV